ncbi:MAG: hypothetical protein AMXMBFR84_27220 [Candidatus Hydrogenedentota bacterium]
MKALRYCWIIPLLLSLHACQTVPESDQAETAKPDEQAAPDRERATGPGLAPLADRLVCLDPGHGGPWPGAVAPSNGIREADVNLAVALQAKTILEQAGVRVLMTRETDTALVADSLSKDLAARADFANRADADLFVSVHHNADIQSGSPKNDLEVYYKLGDDAASLDLAGCLVETLSRGAVTSEAPKRLLPGNYKVLRLSHMPAVLLETAYVTDAASAERLASPEGIAAEAKAIADGIIQYFTLDPPFVAGIDARELDQGGIHEIMVGLPRGMPVDSASINVLIDGIPRSGEIDFVAAGFIWTLHDPLPNGPHTINVRGKNLKGASFSGFAPVAIARPPATILVNQQPPAAPQGSSMEMMMQVRVLDPSGFPVADGTPVRLAETGQTAQTFDGVVEFYAPADRLPESMTFEAGEAKVGWRLAGGGPPMRSLRVKDKETGNPVPGSVIAADGLSLGVTSQGGWLALPESLSNIIAMRNGYLREPVTLGAGHTDILLTPMSDPAVRGRVIVIDAAAGGRDPGMAGPTGLRGSDVALDVSQRIAGMLRDLGAEVHLSRVGDEEISDVERVLMAEDLGAEVLVSVAFGLTPARAKVLAADGYQRTDLQTYVGHYPESPNGQKLASAMAALLEGTTVTPCVSYVVQQTGSVAVQVQPGTVEDPAMEAKLRAPAARKAVADAITQGLVRYFQETPR